MIELDVAPLRPVSVTWAAVSTRWPHELPEELAPLLPEVPVLRMLGGHEAVDPDVALEPELNCWVDLGRPGNLGLAVHETEPLGFDESLVIEDYGRNLSAEEQRRIASAWRNVGSAFYLSSGGGRAKGDLDLMAALAIALAALTEGVVITEDNYGAMETGVGAFSAEEFRVAMWGTGAVGG